MDRHLLQYMTTAQRQAWRAERKPYLDEVKARRRIAVKTQTAHDAVNFLMCLSSELVLWEMLLLQADTKFSAKEFWLMFHDQFSRCDNATRDLDMLMAVLKRRAAEVEPTQFLVGEDAAFFKSLPDKVTVYRGADRSRIRGVSWTIDRKVAEGFALGHRGMKNTEPVIASATIARTEILSAIQERNESEIVILPPDEMEITTYERQRPPKPIAVKMQKISNAKRPLSKLTI
jgi:hypothetical protein